MKQRMRNRPALRHEPRDMLAEILHGDDCTCPFSLEDDDKVAANIVMARLASKGYEIVMRPDR